MGACAINQCKLHRQAIPAFLVDESGQDLIEYALVAALIALGCVSAVGGLGTSISNLYTTVTSRLTSAT